MSPGAPYVVAAVDGMLAADVETVECPDLVSAAEAYARLRGRYAGNRYIIVEAWSPGGVDIDTNGLEDEEVEAIASGDPEFARRTLVEMGWT